MSLHAEWIDDEDIDYHELQRRWEAVQGHHPSLNSLAEESWTIAEEHGFHEPFDPSVIRITRDTWNEVGAWLVEYEAARKGTEADTSGLYVNWTDEEAEVAVKMLLIMTEAYETLDAVLNDLNDPGKEASEIADIIIRVLEYAHGRGINVDAAVRSKMEINRDRPFKHGKNF